MIMNRKNRMFVITLFVLMVVSFGIRLPISAGKQFLSIAGNPIGQTAYQWAAAIADLINRNIPDISATAEETKGYMENVRLLADGQAECGFTNNIILNEAYNSSGSFTNIPPKKVRAVMAISPIVMHVIVLKDSSIKSVYDFEGKKVGIGQPGGSALLDATRLIEALGYKESDFKAYKVNLAEQIDMLKNGQLDVVIWNGSIPLPAVIELATTKKIRFLDIPGKVSAKIIAKYPSYFKYNLNANMYPGQTKTVNSFALENVLMARSDIPENTVYEITKLIMENLAHLKKVHPAFGFVSKNSVLSGLTAPLHPGALKYYREAKIPKIEDFAKKYR
jgi:TRAP transporter TAXI family solute receptor